MVQATIAPYVSQVSTALLPFVPLATLVRDFGALWGIPSLLFHCMRARPVVGHLSWLPSLLGTALIALAGVHSRQLLLGQSLALAVTAQSFLPLLTACWLLTRLAAPLINALPLRIPILLLTAHARLRMMSVAAEQALQHLGPQNVLGIMIVTFAQGAGQIFFIALLRALMGQPHVWQETDAWHFGLFSALVGSIVLTIFHTSIFQPVAFCVLLLWFSIMAVKLALTTPPKTPVENGHGGKKKNKPKSE